MTLHLQDVSLAYPDGTHTRTILDHLDLDIAAGETVAVAGRSGSGKSTLLADRRAPSPPDTGIVSSRQPATRLRSKAAHRDPTGPHRVHLPSPPSLFPALTCLEQSTRRPHRRTARLQHRDPRLTSCSADVGLEHRRDADPPNSPAVNANASASPGPRCNVPDLLLADEPTASLDPERGASLMQLLLEQADVHGTATLIVTGHSRPAPGARPTTRPRRRTPPPRKLHRARGTRLEHHSPAIGHRQASGTTPRGVTVPDLFISSPVLTHAEGTPGSATSRGSHNVPAEVADDIRQRRPRSPESRGPNLRGTRVRADRAAPHDRHPRQTSTPDAEHASMATAPAWWITRVTVLPGRGPRGGLRALSA